MRPEKDTKREQKTHPDAHFHLRAAQETVLSNTEKNLHPDCSMACSGAVTLWDKESLLPPLLTKSTGSEVHNIKTWESS